MPAPAVVEGMLRAGPEAPEAARRLVRDLGLDPETLGNLELVVSELVANSVVHGGAESTGEISLRLQAGAERVSGEIYDGGAGFAWAPHEPELTEPGGLGLVLVDRLAERWGMLRRSPFCVWFVMPQPRTTD